MTDWYVRHPGGVVYLSWRPLPGSSALRASTPGLKSDDPSGASPLRDRQARGSPLRDRPTGALMRFTRGFTNTESQAGARAARHPGRGAPPGVEEETAWHPGRGARCLARMSRGVAPKTPGYRWIPYPQRPRRVSHWLTDSLISATPWRGRIPFLASSPGVFGTACLDTRSKKR